MKICIICPGNIESLPYVKYYTDVFDSINADYEYICWDRDNSINTKYIEHNVTYFKKSSPATESSFRKLHNYWIFSKFVKTKIEKSNFDYVLVHTIACAVFLKDFLINNFKEKYIFDIRDYSPMLPYVKSSMKCLVNNSLFTTISSQGFLRWLPENNKYIISHNIDKALLKSSPKERKIFGTNPYQLLTIGQLRDFPANKSVIDAFANKKNINMVFAGVGPEKNNLALFSIKNCVDNIIFTGRYKKEDESTVVYPSDLLNIILPVDVASNTLMSNRFYLSLVNRRPMIVNVESIQAKFVEQFNLGIIIKSTDDIFSKLVEYSGAFDYETFNNGCEELIASILIDVEKFERIICQHVK